MQALTQHGVRSWGTNSKNREADDVALAPLDQEAEQPQSSIADFQESVCCWNICPAYSVDFKKARNTSAARLPDDMLGGQDQAATALQGEARISDTEAVLASRASVKSQGWGAFRLGAGDKSAHVSVAAPVNQHLTNRLLVETVAPNRHIIFNPLSGSVDLATNADLKLLEALRSGGSVSLTTAQETFLRQQRYLFDSPADEEEFLDGAVQAAWSRMTLAQPQMYTICPTLACNLACPYCFEGDSLMDKAQGVMTQAQVAQAFAAIARIRQDYAAREDEQSGTPYIALFGGEPLLPSTHRCVAEILRLAAEGGFLVGATTNGVNLTRFEDLLTEYADIITVLQVTLDGPKAVHDGRRYRLGGQGTFDEIVRGIDLLLFLGIDVDLRVNLDAANVDALPALIDFIYEKGWQNHPAFDLALAPVTVHGEAGGCSSRYDKALSEMELAQRVMSLAEAHPRVAQTCHLGFLRHLEYLVSVLEPEKLGRGRRGRARTVGPRYWYCEASTDKQYVFTPEGLIYNCTEGVGQPQHAVGRFGPELDLWREEREQWVGRTILSHPKCRDCAISTLCGGGCHIAAREQAGTHADSLLQIALPGRTAAPARRASEPFCNAAEETVRAYLRTIGQSADFQKRTPSLV